MIDVNTETLIDCHAAKKLPAFRVNGRQPHFSTIWRMMLSGKLESAKIGAKRVTSIEAVQRMIARDNPGVPAVTPRQRETALARIEKQLEQAGV